MLDYRVLLGYHGFERLTIERYPEDEAVSVRATLWPAPDSGHNYTSHAIFWRLYEDEEPSDELLWQHIYASLEDRWPPGGFKRASVEP